MADLSGVSDNYLPTASETFSDNLSSSIAAEAAIVPVNSAVEYADGDTVVLTVAPGTANEATFVGKKDAGQNRFIECVWTEGNTSVGHDAGTTIIDYDSATHFNLLSEALQLIMNQDGTLKDDPIRTALGLSDLSNDGWEVFPYTFSVSSGYNKGRKSFELTVANQDVTGLLSPGMRLRLERATTAPTQCLDLEAGSSQYASKSSPSGIVFTDDFTCEAWVKLESYDNVKVIVSRHDGTSGFKLYIDANGKINFQGDVGATADTVISEESIPLARWVHVAATLDMSGAAGVIYVDGKAITSTYSNTAATAIVQAGNLQVGAANGGEFFDGKIADVRVWSAVRTATEIADNMNQLLTGSESNLVAYFKLNGDLADSTSNANNLTGSGGAVATNTDNPFSSTQYAIITKVAYSAPNSTVTVFTGTDHMIPNMTLNSPHYSVQKTPFGFPSDVGKWLIEVLFRNNRSTSSSSLATLTDNLVVPIGAWQLEFKAILYFSSSSTANDLGHVTLSSDGSTRTHYNLSLFNWKRESSAAATSAGGASLHTVDRVNLAVETTFLMLGQVNSGADAVNVYTSTHDVPTVIRAVCAYI